MVASLKRLALWLVKIVENSMIWKAFFLRYTLGFFVTIMTLSWLTIVVAKFLVSIHLMPAVVYSFWVWAGGPTMVYAAALSVRTTIRKKDPEEWGIPVARFFTFTSCLAAFVPFLTMHLPNTEVALGRFVGHIDIAIRDKFDPPPEQITIQDAYTEHWFGPDGPLIWYAQNPNGSDRFYNRKGIDPVTGSELRPVTESVVDEEKRRETEANKEAQRQRDQQAQEEKGATKVAKAQADRVAVAKKTDAAAVQRRQDANDAAIALQAGEYDQALIDCPTLGVALQTDPCANVRQQALVMKADHFAKQSQEEVQEYRLDDAVRDAQQALNLNPSNDTARRALRLAETLKQQSGASSPQ